MCVCPSGCSCHWTGDFMCGLSSWCAHAVLCTSVGTNLSCHVSRSRRSSYQRWWTGSRRSLELLSWWTKTAAWCPLWSITSDTTSRMSKDTTSKLTKGKEDEDQCMLFLIMTLMCKRLNRQSSKYFCLFLETRDLVFFCTFCYLFFNFKIKAFNPLVCRDPEFVFYDQLKQTMNAYR